MIDRRDGSVECTHTHAGEHDQDQTERKQARIRVSPSQPERDPSKREDHDQLNEHCPVVVGQNRVDHAFEDVSARMNTAADADVPGAEL